MTAATVAASTGILIAFGPLAAAIVVGVFASMLLEHLDEKYNVTDKVIAALVEIDEKGIQGIINEKKNKLINKGERILGNVTESVIDYAIERVEDSLKNIIDQLFRRLPLPAI